MLSLSRHCELIYTGLHGMSRHLLSCVENVTFMLRVSRFLARDNLE